MQLPELLAPAGNAERFKTALRFGADAIYVGLKRMSLRNFADNFTISELEELCALAHGMSRRVYVACNAFARDEDFDGLETLVRQVRGAGADALIVSDPGVVALTKQSAPELDIHLSTQANTVNSYAASFWHEQGVKRIILARELTLEQIRRIRDNTPNSLELEMFVHGAMCVSYSGRCLLSGVLSGRSANRGECSQPCRWQYELREAGKDGEYYTIEQDELGSYILNSKDLMLIEYIDALIGSGVCSLKIEGRMKTAFYVAGVVNAYRMALDAYAKSPVKRGFRPERAVVEELYKVSHRPFTTGFAFDAHNPDTLATEAGGTVQQYDFAAVVLDYDAAGELAIVEQRNRFFVGDTLEILSPGDIGRSFTVESIINEEGQLQDSAPHPQQRLKLKCTERLLKGDILRKRSS